MTTFAGRRTCWIAELELGHRLQTAYKQGKRFLPESSDSIQAVHAHIQRLCLLRNRSFNEKSFWTSLIIMLKLNDISVQT